MKLVRCPNQHYYDAHEFSSCPECQQERGLRSSAAADEGADVTVLDEPAPQQHSIFMQQPVPHPSARTGMPAEDDDDDHTVAFYGIGPADPVVGWLVCLEGAYFGESFPLKSGQNFVGRDLSMDVALRDEKTVSRQAHAVVTFDPEGRAFYLSPGMSSGVTYLNGQILLTPAMLKAHDEIRFGWDAQEDRG